MKPLVNCVFFFCVFYVFVAFVFLTLFSLVHASSFLSFPSFLTSFFYSSLSFFFLYTSFFCNLFFFYIFFPSFLPFFSLLTFSPLRLLFLSLFLLFFSVHVLLHLSPFLPSSLKIMIFFWSSYNI